MEVSIREAEVLGLVGEHLTNAEIAARLYISVRTVESHVSSLLRKLEAPDRRSLARYAASRAGHSEQASPVLPTSLTPFIGRARERAELADAMRTHRQVTAVGPSGVGKTRLAIAVAADIASAYADGVWFVDLVSTTDPGMVAATTADSLGLGEQPGRDMAGSVLTTLRDRQALLVLDNCEHVIDGVAPFLERLLSNCPRMTVLATSRARLMVPFERVYQVPSLSLDRNEGSDAVALFLDRAAMTRTPLDTATHDAITILCERLDGMALAIELAAARVSTLGLDGLTAAIADPLRMLTGGSRANDRHQSMRATLDWSHALLDPADQVLLRSVTVFAAPFTAESAAEIAGLAPGVTLDGLARLAEQSLLTVTITGDATRYRALEPIRQYGTERLSAAGELDDTRARHLRWCLTAATALQPNLADWRAHFDVVVDDLRAALTWAAYRPEWQAEAHDLATRLAELTFFRGLIGESQRHFEQAAELGKDKAAAAKLLRHAAAVAGCRMHGDDMYRLHREVAAAAHQHGDSAGAARDLAIAATTAHRFWSRFTKLPSHADTMALVSQARDLAGDEPMAQASVALAESGVLFDAFGAIQGPVDNAVAETLAGARRAVELAQRTGDPLAESAALDALTGALSWNGDTFGAADMARRRIELLSTVPDGPSKAHELIDALGNASEAALGAGQLADARQWARKLADLSLLAEVGHRATSCLLVADAIAGDVNGVLAGAERFLEGWQRAGSPAKSVFSPAVTSVAAIHSLRGDVEEQRRWTDILHRLGTPLEHRHGYGAVFDSIHHLHYGENEKALERLQPEPDTAWKWVTWIWHHWYVAFRAEAAALSAVSEAGDIVAGARSTLAGNPIADAIVERADAVLHRDRPRLLATVTAFESAGCRYQAARSLVLAGGDEARRGQQMLANLGFAPMKTGATV